jgi:hypothetical protein
LVFAQEAFVTPLSRPSGSSFFEDFHCQECGGREAYRSRPRGFFEKYLLPLLFLQPVRCERCFHRTYAWNTIPTLGRAHSERKPSQSQAVDASKSDRFVASGDQRGYTGGV